jgi:hypothetical protein
MWQYDFQILYMYCAFFLIKLLFTLQRKRERAAVLGRGKFFLYCSLEAAIEAATIVTIVSAILFAGEKGFLFGADFSLLTFVVFFAGGVGVRMILRNLPYIRDSLADLEGPPKPVKSK